MRNLTVVLRSLRKSRGFTAAVVLTLALAIGVNTVIFSAVEAVVLRPFPVPGLERVVDVGHYDERFAAHYGLNPAEVFDLETRHDLFDAVAGYRSIDANLSGIGAPQRVAAVATTGDLFGVFGVRPYLGRSYGERDEQAGATSVVVLSYDFWRALTGGDKSAVGRVLRLNDSSFTLVGVLPPGFSYPLGVQLWTPRPLDQYLNRNADQATLHGGLVVPTVARIRAGLTMPRIRSELAAAMRAWAARQPQFYEQRARTPIEARPLGDTWAGKLKAILFALTFAVTLVLLIACANVASLQLLRTTGRAREIAVRMALGGSRRAILGLLVTESAVLAVAGGVLGVALGQALVTSLGRVAADAVPELRNLRLDPLVLACSASVTLVAAFLFGVGPAVRAVHTNSRDVLSDGATRTGSSGRTRNRFLHGAVVAQVALSLMLLLSSTTAARSLIKLVDVDPGFDPTGVVTARLVMPPRYAGGNTIELARQALAGHEELLARLRAVPGFDAVGLTDVAPFSYRGTLDASIHRLAVTTETGPDAFRRAVPANMWSVDAAYFGAMRIPIRSGRGLTGTEQADWLRDYPKNQETHIVIDEALARRLFGDEDPVGKMIDPPYFRVVGVVGTVKKSELAATTDDIGAIYLPSAETLADLTIVVRSSLPIGQATTRLRDAVHGFDPKLPLFDIMPLSDIVSHSLASRRIAAWLLAALATVSLVLALLGIYAVLSYATAQRTKEIGIRLALGAMPAEVVRMVTRTGATLTGVGLGLGGVAYLAAQRGMSALTYGVSPYDPQTLFVAAAILASAGLVATLPAAIRAARINPVEALRSE